MLNHIYCFNYGATVSNAHSGASLSGIRYGIEPLVHGITHSLWLEDEPHHFAVTRSWTAIDTDPSALASRVWKAKPWTVALVSRANKDSKLASLTERVYAALRMEILTCELEPGPRSVRGRTGRALRGQQDARAGSARDAAD